MHNLCMKEQFLGNADLKSMVSFLDLILLATFPYPVQVTIINQEIEEVEKGDFEFLRH